MQIAIIRLSLCVSVAIIAALIEMYVNQKLKLTERQERFASKLINVAWGGLMTAILFVW
jgi:hypothetical protein